MNRDSTEKADQLEPPKGLKNRTLHVQPDGVVSVHVPFDLKNESGMKWIVAWPKIEDFSKNNRVRYFTSGREAFRQMRKAIESATESGHFVYMINWWFDINITIGGPDFKSLRTLLGEASDRGASIRCIIGGRTTPGKTEPDAINRASQKIMLDWIPNCSAVLDDHGFYESTMSHHQKMLCVFGKEGLIAFCGGVDFNLDRIASVPDSPGSPLCDVHCRISGSAAISLLENFRFRWKENVSELIKQIFKSSERAERIAKEFGINKDNALNSPEFRKQKLDIVEPDTLGKYAFSESTEIGFPDSHWVQITKTFGGDVYQGLPSGNQSIKRQIVNGIKYAKRFIYTEDQYFVGNEDLQRELCAAVSKPDFKHLTVLATHWRVNDFLGVQRRRKDFINALRASGGDKVRVLTLWPDAGRVICRSIVRSFELGDRPAQETIIWSDESGKSMDPPDPHYIMAYGAPFMDGVMRKQKFRLTAREDAKETYIHSKVWIFDDQFAVIGSANSNNRSWYTDSEIAAGIYDPASDSKPRNRFARALRMSLWAKHLNLPESELADGVASAVHWLRPPRGSMVKPYDENTDMDFTLAPDLVVDPGSSNRHI
jgi:phosphatidylserine/phosphatidylglycerophosphate/cardiolipin synthase-like enzyme